MRCCFKFSIRLCLNGAIGGRLARTARWHDGLQVVECTTHPPAVSTSISKLPWHIPTLIKQCVWIIFLCGSESSNNYDDEWILIVAWFTLSIDRCHLLFKWSSVWIFSRHKEIIRIRAPAKTPCIGFMVIPSSNWRKWNDDDRNIDKFAVM